MKSKNKFLFFVISLVLILTVSVGAISAQDTGSNGTGVTVDDGVSLDSTSFEKVSSDTQAAAGSAAKNKKSVESDRTVKSDDNQKIVQSKDNVKSKNSLKRDGSGNFNALNTLITSSENVSLNMNYVRDTTESAVVINKTVSINGNGYNIDANNQNGTFVIGADADVTIRNVNFINAKVTGSDTTKASVYVDGGMLTLVNVTFENNNGSYGSVVHAYDGTTKIYNSTFKGVNYGSQGAVHHSFGTLIVEGSVFNGTTSNQGTIQVNYGSAVANVTNSTFVNNHANSYGGAINNKGLLTVDNCLFENNSAGTNGGALSLRGSKPVTVQNSRFISNKVEGTKTTNKGGAISINSGYLSLKNNTMTDNYAYNGSDIFVWYANTVHDVNLTFEDARAIEDEIINLKAKVTDDMGNRLSNTDVTFTVNGQNYTAPLVNGVAELSISESIEPGNYTVEGSWEGAVLDDLKVTNSNLEVVQADVFKYKMLQDAIDNDATGVVKLEKDVKRGSIEDSVVVNKTVTIDGNGLFINANRGRIFNVNNSAVLTLKNMKIFNTYYGEGAIANITGSSKVILNNVTIFNNTGISANNKPSSFFYVDSGSQMDINDTYFTENNKGALLRLQGSATINNTQVTNVMATDYNDKGFIINECTGTNSLTIENSVFNNNSAKLGGIYGQAQDGQMNIKNTTFSNNTLTTGSGTVWAGGKTTITNTTMVNNKAKGYSSTGTAIYNKGDLTITKSVFINNTLPTGKDGSILINGYGGKADITYSILIPSGTNTALYNNNAATSTANYNWWGTNTNISKYLGHGSEYDDLEDETTEYPDFTVDYWAVLNTTTEPAGDIPYNSKVKVTTTLNTYTDKSGNIKELTDKLPSDGLMVEYATSNKGSFEKAQTAINGGTTTNTYTVLSPSTQITIKQANQVNTIDIDAVMPEPQEYMITEENFGEYFNADGTINTDKVVYGSKLQFSGTLNNKEIIINMPVNLTTYTTPANFVNLKITVLADGKNTNITNLIISNSNDYENVILLNDTANITIKNNTITAQSATKIHTIELINTNTTLIDNNTIITNGPSNKITYDDYVGYADTSSIKLYNSYNNTISNNNVMTKASTTDGSSYNTINGVEIYGNAMDWEEDIQSNYNKILNNNITTEGGRYVYSVTLSSKVNNNTVQNNKIVAKGEHYANGLQLTGPAAENDISYNDVSATAENITYGLYISTNDMGPVTNNMISYNNVTANSSTSYVVELYGANENTIKFNNITNDVAAPDYAMGIGLYNSKENNITDNMINVIGYEVNNPVGGDSISAENVGIKLTQNSNSNKIQNNNITSQAASGTNYAINMSNSSSNTVKENTLITTGYMGDLAVTTNSLNTVESNKPENQLDTVITMDSLNNPRPGENVTINVTLTDTEGKGLFNQNITLNINGNSVIITTNATGVATYVYEVKTLGLLKITAVYDGSTVYKQNSTSQKVTVNKIPAVIIISDITTKINDSTIITIKVVDNDNLNNPVTDGKVILKINGKTLRDSEGNIRYADLNENGTATVTTSFNLKAGTYTISAIYGGNAYYASARIGNTTLTVTPREAELTINNLTSPAVSGSDVSFIVSVKDGSALVNGGRVLVKLNGKSVRDSNGNILYKNVESGEANIKFTVPATFKAKTYNLTVVYAGSSYTRTEESTSLEVTTLKTVAASLKTIDTSIITDAHTVKSNDSTTEIL